MASKGEPGPSKGNAPLPHPSAVPLWKSRLLVLILDIHDSSHYATEDLGRLETPAAAGVQVSSELSLPEYLNHAVAFANAYLMAHHDNALAVILAHQLGSDFVYTFSEEKKLTGCHAGLRSAKQEDVATMNIIIQEEITRVASHLTATAPSEVPQYTCLSGALSKSLCYIQRCLREKPVGASLKPRILVIRTSSDSPPQYNATMNCIFAAQKDSIPIDSCVLWQDSGFLQQASDITNGIYLHAPEPRALLQYLLWVFLPDESMRQKLCLPHTTSVDYRAACQCHSQLVELGYVCSVCLSIFCQLSPICSVCQTHFKVPALPLMKPGKGKKKKNKALHNGGGNSQS